MKAAIIVIAGIMATACPVFEDESDKINYLIKYSNYCRLYIDLRNCGIKNYQ